MTSFARLSCVVGTLPGGACCVTLTGELDLDNAPGLRSELNGIVLERGQYLVIDMTGVTFCDSSGVTALLNAYDRAQSVGATLVAAGLTEIVRRVFELTGLSRVITAYPTPAAAVAALAGPSA